jgi:hypothetical protein
MAARASKGKSPSSQNRNDGPKTPCDIAGFGPLSHSSLIRARIPSVNQYYWQNPPGVAYGHTIIAGFSFIREKKRLDEKSR